MIHEEDVEVSVGVDIRWIELECPPIGVLEPPQVALAVEDTPEVAVYIRSFRTDFKNRSKAGHGSIHVSDHHALICNTTDQGQVRRLFDRFCFPDGVRG